MCFETLSSVEMGCLTWLCFALDATIIFSIYYHFLFMLSDNFYLVLSLIMAIREPDLNPFFPPGLSFHSPPFSSVKNRVPTPKTRRYLVRNSIACLLLLYPFNFRVRRL